MSDIMVETVKKKKILDSSRIYKGTKTPKGLFIV